MTTQTALGRQFAAGHDPSRIGDASNVAVEPCDIEGYDALIRGYGHAVYAVRRDDGEITIFEGWRGRSSSTSCQLTKIGSGVADAAATPKIDDTARPSSKFGHPDLRETLGAPKTQ